jgi:dGTPase
LLDYANKSNRNRKLRSEPIYDLTNQKEYHRAILDFIAGMTDNFAIKCFTELISF